MVRERFNIPGKTSEITSLKSVPIKGRNALAEPRCLIELDGSPWEEIEGETVLRHGLKRGRRLSPDDCQGLLQFDEELKAKRWAAARCAMKPRSRRHLELELRKRKYPEATIRGALDQLESTGTLNDEEVAARHLRKRGREGGYGPARIRMELMAMGINSRTVDAAMSNHQHEREPHEECLLLARKRAVRYEPLSEAKNRSRMIKFLQRRGYDGESIQKTLEILSNEIEGGQGYFPLEGEV